jgi:hypothetical protein
MTYNNCVHWSAKYCFHILFMHEKCNPRQNLFTNVQTLSKVGICVSVFIILNSYQCFEEHNSYIWLSVIFFIKNPKSPNEPTRHRRRGFEITLGNTTVVRTPLNERYAAGNKRHSQETHIHVLGRDSNPDSQEAIGRSPTPRPCDHRHWPVQLQRWRKYNVFSLKGP